MSRVEEARKMFGSYNCAQTVLGMFCEERGLDRKLACRLACGFGAGMARSSRTCGAVTGAVMAIGISVDFGATRDDYVKGKEKTYALVQEFMKRFTERFGTTGCRELLACDLGTPEGQARAKEERLFETLCPGYVTGAVEILEDLLK